MVDLPKVKTKNRKKRVGRGFGSGKGAHTSGRGMKGQKSRTSKHILFEGLKMRKSLLVRLPLTRGKGKNKSFREKPFVIDLAQLNRFKKNSVVDIKQLINSGLVDKKTAAKRGVKVLGRGGLEKSLTVSLPVSSNAKKAIESAGGSVK